MTQNKGGLAIAILVTQLLCPAAPVLASINTPITSSVSLSVVIPAHTGNLDLSGRASPGAVVSFMQKGAVIGTTVADASAAFDKLFTGLDPNTQTFDIYASDNTGLITNTSTFTATVISDSTVTLSGFLLPPTVTSQQLTIKRPAFQSLNGTTIPGATVTVFLDGSALPASTQSDAAGSWKITVSKILHLGAHTAVALVQDGQGNQSLVGAGSLFNVVQSADLNMDNAVDLTDFSILLYNYGQTNPPNPAADINDDGIVDLIDFSIMLYNWTA